MKRVGIVSIIIVCLGIAGYSYYPLFASDEQSEKNITIVFDLGGVLIGTNMRSALWQLGPRTVLSYFISNRSISRMQKEFYAALNRIDQTQGNPFGAKDPDGKNLPYLMTEWLMSTRPNAQIMATIEQEVTQHPEWFSTKQEQQLIIAMARMIFNPEVFIQTCRPIPEMVQLVQQLKKEGYHLYVLSNWDAESFALLEKKYPDLFNVFDKVIISGQVHMMKPDPAIFALITHDVPANESIFIDDQPENIEAAKQMGIHTILATPKQSLLGKRPDVQKINAEIKRLTTIIDAEKYDERCVPASA